MKKITLCVLIFLLSMFLAGKVFAEEDIAPEEKKCDRVIFVNQVIRSKAPETQ